MNVVGKDKIKIKRNETITDRANNCSIGVQCVVNVVGKAKTQITGNGTHCKK